MRYANFALFMPVIALSVGLGACQSPSNPTNSAGQLPALSKPILVAKPTPIVKVTPVSKPSIVNGAQIATVNNTMTFTDSTAPWRQPAIAATATEAVYSREWAKSETQDKCPLLVLPKTAAAQLANRSVRRANFSGGWGVAYDLPKERSAYGVAHSGISDPVGQAAIWQDYHLYNDGTELTYGREGGDPQGKWLAYLTLGTQYSPAGQHCFYNIWSQQSKTHLEQIITELRLVAP